MVQDDIPAAVALSDSVGWSHTTADWQRVFDWSEGGCFVLDETERGIIGAVTTTAYGTSLAWIGNMIVAPDRQRRGFGQQLMRAALDHLILRNTERIMLDATDVGRPLYERVGFRPVQKVERWEGRASTYLGPRARRLTADDLAPVLELDRLLFGLPRSHILTRLLDEFPELAWVDRQRGRVDGFLLGHRGRQGVTLGPWMCWDAPAAERLLRVALEQLQGQHITLNIPDINGRALMLVRDHNFKRVRTCTRMIYGNAQPVKKDLLGELAVATLATG